MLQKRNQRRRHRNDLLRGNVHKLDFLRLFRHIIALLPAGNEFFDKRTVGIQLCVGLSDDVFIFVHGGKVFDFFRRLSVDNLPVRGFQKSVVIDLCVIGQRNNQSDIRTFRRLNRTHTPVMGVVNVADLKSGPVARQPAGTQRAQTPLVRQFGERVHLIHELRQLA